MKINLKIWRQPNNKSNGQFQIYEVDNVSEDMSFFEMLDKLNNESETHEKQYYSESLNVRA